MKKPNPKRDRLLTRKRTARPKRKVKGWQGFGKDPYKNRRERLYANPQEELLRLRQALEGKL